MSFPAIVARVDPRDLTRIPIASELVVQRMQSAVGDQTIWVFIGEAETAHRLTIAAEFSDLLRESLPAAEPPDVPM